MHTGLSEEQRRQIEKMRRQSGRMPVYRKTAEKVNDFSETETFPFELIILHFLVSVNYKIYFVFIFSTV